GLHPHRRRPGALRRCLARKQSQLDAELWRGHREAMRRQAGVCSVDHLQQRRAGAVEAEVAAQELLAHGERGAAALAERVGVRIRHAVGDRQGHPRRAQLRASAEWVRPQRKKVARARPHHAAAARRRAGNRSSATEHSLPARAGSNANVIRRSSPSPRPPEAIVMLKILVGHAYYLKYDRKQWERGKPYPPLATIQVAALLRRLGHEVALFDAMLAEGVEDFAASLHGAHPDVVVLYEDNFNFLTKMCLGRMREAACRMIAEARAAGARVIVAGSDASDHPEAFLAAGAEAVLIG